jgi:hypothetical protein
VRYVGISIFALGCGTICYVFVFLGTLVGCLACEAVRCLGTSEKIEGIRRTWLQEHMLTTLDIKCRGWKKNMA